MKSLIVLPVVFSVLKWIEYNEKDLKAAPKVVFLDARVVVINNCDIYFFIIGISSKKNEL